MDRSALKNAIEHKKSFLCVGLDPDLNKIPAHLWNEPNPVLTFNKAIIDATADYAVAYKPNLAFYEALGSQGWEILKATLEYIPKSMLTIADAKRGDIGNTAHQYASALFKEMNFDAVTLSPYMGRDSIEPFLAYEGKWAIILALTSNPGAKDFQNLESDGMALYEHIISKALDWGTSDQIMFVIGRTEPQYLQTVRKHCPMHFLLVPGIGKQGGDLDKVATYALNDDYGLLVNVGRSILYASPNKDFDYEAGRVAAQFQKTMQPWLSAYSDKGD